ncbi:hypothetical protein BDY21DRAFT_375675 [Lineolata rhizophorae]|uniref:Mad3/BUB1 homology region 1-domain-containing protein n=1 Tax=Lineolata rhizophorae TaxID=578093 RepID=A0A6A6NL92_9PEZI|nr:hypothetical protein BDY21DRAFT_375675 [Lineolata rhizophorae]
MAARAPPPPNEAAAGEDLISFEVIEDHKENIQSLPSGRSAKALAALYSPRPGSDGSGGNDAGSGPQPPTPADTQTLNEAVRADFEKEVAALDEADDPLDVFDRYVKWTLDAYPSAQSTPASQLLPLLERATRAFLESKQYRNDARYLRLWLHYIRLFSDAPREHFAFLARRGVGEHLALFYEEFAAWFELRGRWAQADEIFRLGVDKQARPVERLVRKYAEFQHRAETRRVPGEEDGRPASPALPVVRPALAPRLDPFAAAEEQQDPQAQRRGLGQSAGGAARAGKPKIAIFSDADGGAAAGDKGALAGGGGSKGWETIQSIGERKKENTVEAKPWAGETMRMSKPSVGVPKMMVYKDETVSNINASKQPSSPSSSNPVREHQKTVNPKTGRVEEVFADLEAVYPDAADPSAVEFCFEELRAKHRGWLECDWIAVRREEALRAKEEEVERIDRDERARRREQQRVAATTDPAADEPSSQRPEQQIVGGLRKLVVLNDENDENAPPPPDKDIAAANLRKQRRREERANRTRKIKVMEVREVRGETQRIQTNLDSPTGPKIKRKKSAEPTMTINTREAMDEIYGIFNEPLKEPAAEAALEEESDEPSDVEDDYTSAGESTGTGRISATTSEFGDETTAAGDFTEVKSTADGDETTADTTADTTSDVKSVSEWSEFTERRHVPKTTGYLSVDEGTDTQGFGDETTGSFEALKDGGSEQDWQEPDGVVTPTSPEPAVASRSLPTRFVPVPPENCEVPTRPYRDPAQAANNRLPFMTPIVEKTESSLGGMTNVQPEKDYFTSKTPSRRTNAKTPTVPELGDDDIPLSSPFQNVVDEPKLPPPKIAQPILTKGKRDGSTKPLACKSPEKMTRPQTGPAQEAPQKGPIVNDTQCNPVDEHIRKTILRNCQPPLASFDGYYDRTTQCYEHSAEIKKFTKVVAKTSKNNGDRTATNLPMPPTLRFDGSNRTYVVKRELGQGAFAPVYLVESNADDTDSGGENKTLAMGKDTFCAVTRRELEAIKMEEPPTAWEFYIVRQAHRRLGASRAADSLIRVHEMHLFRDECYLVEEYRGQGTLLDLVNVARADPAQSGGGGGGGLDEHVCMFFTVELLRTVESLHAKGIIHGDLKPDNVLVRLDGGKAALPSSEWQQRPQWSAQYRRDGRDGWESRGVALIDFGRGIDMRAFRPDVQFVADWKTTPADCAEMRELRPWTFQVDYHGLAGVVHTMLFGKYIDTVAERGGALLGAGATRKYRVRESLKRYWQTEIWADVFDLLLNPLTRLDGEEDSKMPVLNGMRAVRECMEEYLEANCDRGIGLKGQLRKLEAAVAQKRK